MCTPGTGRTRSARVRIVQRSWPTTTHDEDEINWRASGKESDASAENLEKPLQAGSLLDEQRESEEHLNTPFNLLPSSIHVPRNYGMLLLALVSEKLEGNSINALVSRKSVSFASDSGVGSNRGRATFHASRDRSIQSQSHPCLTSLKLP